jgi:hypothetical protein
MPKVNAPVHSFCDASRLSLRFLNEAANPALLFPSKTDSASINNELRPLHEPSQSEL